MIVHGYICMSVVDVMWLVGSFIRHSWVLRLRYLSLESSYLISTMLCVVKDRTDSCTDVTYILHYSSYLYYVL